MKIISNSLIQNFKKKIINIHPSLLPKYKGLNTFSRMLKNKEIKAGCTVHYVNEKLDAGNTIVQKTFLLKKMMNEQILKKTQNLEYRAFPEAIIKIFRNFNFKKKSISFLHFQMSQIHVQNFYQLKYHTIFLLCFLQHLLD